MFCCDMSRGDVVFPCFDESGDLHQTPKEFVCVTAQDKEQLNSSLSAVWNWSLLSLRNSLVPVNAIASYGMVQHVSASHPPSCGLCNSITIVDSGIYL